MSGFIAGSLSDDAAQLARNGWTVGSFFEKGSEESDRYTESLEVKYWEFASGEGKSHSAKLSATTEWTYIISGELHSEVGDKRVVLGAGDYILIHPGVPNNLVAEVVRDTKAITVKAPSDPAAKKII